MIKCHNKHNSALLLLTLLLALLPCVIGNIVVNVDAGDVAILHCPSNEDTHHRFYYWQAGDDKIIGPGNAFNHSKYKYESWSGQLFIKSVTRDEAGVYKCISRHVANAELNVKTVQLVVDRDFEVAFEEDPQTNAYRAAIAILVLIIMTILGVFVFFIRQRRTRDFGELTREESPEAGPSSGRITQRAYNPTTTELPPPSRNDRSLDNAIVETDIKTSFALTDYP